MKIGFKQFGMACIALLIILTVCSCGKDYSPTEASPKIDLPDMVMEDASYTFGNQGRSPLLMKAAKISVYNKKTNKTVLENIEFVQQEVGPDGVLYTEMEGSCELAEVTGNNSKAVLSGNIRLYKRTDNFYIQCDELVWDDEKQRIHTDSTVSVTYEDDTFIVASGFNALLDENVYEFNKIMEGTFTSED